MAAGVLAGCGGCGWAQTATVTARVEIVREGRAARSGENALLWLTPTGGSGSGEAIKSAAPKLVQRNKSFEPHLLVVPVGAVVDFPNRDPFFHNVFSLFDGKRFDLGLYEAGTSREIRFEKPGISYIFCNIHPQMSAVVVALETPYYGISNERGEVTIAGVPPGSYRLRVFSELATPESLKLLTREVVVPNMVPKDGWPSVVVQIREAAVHSAHKNKYGREYDRSDPPNPAYERP